MKRKENNKGECCEVTITFRKTKNIHNITQAELEKYFYEGLEEL